MKPACVWCKAISSPSRRDWFWRQFLIPVGLLVVVLVQTARILQLDQSSWGAGCGFGMFATVDAHGTRFFRVHADIDGNKFPVSLEGVFFEEGVAARITPTPENMRRFQRRLMQHNFTLVTFRDDVHGEWEKVLVARVNTWQQKHPKAETLLVEPCRPRSLDIELRGMAFNPGSCRLDSFAKCRVCGDN